MRSAYYCAVGEVAGFVSGSPATIGFANPWRDYKGRFAPTGYGRSGRLGPRSLNDDSDRYQSGALQSDAKFAAGLEEWSDSITEDMGKMIGEPVVAKWGHSEADGQQAFFNMSFETLDGREVADIEREFDTDYDGVLFMSATSLFVGGRFRGNGVGTLMQESFEDFAVAQGAERVELTAVSAGKWAWMKAGYDFNPADTTPKELEKIAAAISGVAGTSRLTEAERDTAVRYVSEFKNAATHMESNETFPDSMPTPFELSQLLTSVEVTDPVFEFPTWSGIKNLGSGLVASAGGSRADRVAAVVAAYDVWWLDNMEAVDPTADSYVEFDYSGLDVLVDGGALAASGTIVEFANTWRDEMGRFAEKGYIAAGVASTDMEEALQYPSDAVLAAVSDYYEDPSMISHGEAIGAVMEQMGTDDDEDADLVVQALHDRHSVGMSSDVYLNEISELYGIERQTAIDTIVESAQKQVDESALSTRMTEESLASVIFGEDDRFKTQFETGDSGGRLDFAARQEAEFSLYGTDPFQTNVEERPIYGYFDVKGTNNSFNGSSLALDSYGQVRVEFHDSVRDRTTVTFEDSLGKKLMPAPARQVHVDAVLRSGSVNIHNPSSGSPYVEAQMHGGVSAANISRVVFPVQSDKPGAPAWSPPSQSVVDRLWELGIPVWGTDGNPIDSGQVRGQGRLPGVLSLASDAGDVWYVSSDGATITYAGLDDQGRPVGYITRDGRVYDENLIIVLVAHGGPWVPVSEAGSASFTMNGSVEFANTWRDELGRFAKKGYQFTPSQIRDYEVLRGKGVTEADALKQIGPPAESSEIPFNELRAGAYYKPEQYPSITSEDEKILYDAKTRWAAPDELTRSGELPQVEMERAAARAAKGYEVEATEDSVYGIGLMKGMGEAPRSDVPMYRGLAGGFEERQQRALASVAKDLGLVRKNYLPPTSEGAGGALLRFEPGTPYREVFAGSFGQIEEGIVSGRFKWTQIEPQTDAEWSAVSNQDGSMKEFWSGEYLGPLMDEDDASLTIEDPVSGDVAFAAHDLIFWERRRTPSVVPKGKPAHRVKKPSYGKVVKRRPATADEEKTIRSGGWVRVNKKGEKPSDPNYKKSKSKMRPQHNSLGAATIVALSNVWRDERGRFARKGYTGGRGTLLTEAESDVVRKYDVWLEAKADRFDADDWVDATLTVQAALDAYVDAYESDAVSEEFRKEFGRVIEVGGSMFRHRAAIRAAYGDPETIDAHSTTTPEEAASKLVDLHRTTNDRRLNTTKDRQHEWVEYGTPAESAIGGLIADWSGRPAGVREMRSRLAAGDAEALLARDVIRAAPPSEIDLYRGFDAQSGTPQAAALKNLKPGDTIDMDSIGSFSESRDHANGFGETLITLTPGAAALPIAPISNTPFEREWLVAGDMTVTGIGKTHDGEMLVEVEYAGVSAAPNDLEFATAEELAEISLLLGVPLHLDPNHPPVGDVDLTIDTSVQFANVWRDEMGRFAEKGYTASSGEGVRYQFGDNRHWSEPLVNVSYSHENEDGEQEWVDDDWALKHYGSIETAFEMTESEREALRAELDNMTDVQLIELGGSVPHWVRADGYPDLTAGQALQFQAMEEFRRNGLPNHAPGDRDGWTSQEYDAMLGDFKSGKISADEWSDRVATEYGVTIESAAVSFVHEQWAGSSSKPSSVAAMRSVSERHGLDVSMGRYEDWLSSATTESGPGSNKLQRSYQMSSELGGTIDAVTGSTYRKTQQMLSEANIDGLTVHRGVTAKGKYSGLEVDGTLTANPLSSWSSNVSVATDFATTYADSVNGVVVSSSIENSDVWGFSGIGAGSSKEEEFILLGNDLVIGSIETEFAVAGEPVYIDDTQYGGPDWIKKAGDTRNA